MVLQLAHLPCVISWCWDTVRNEDFLPPASIHKILSEDLSQLSATCDMEGGREEVRASGRKMTSFLAGFLIFCRVIVFWSKHSISCASLEGKQGSGGWDPHCAGCVVVFKEKEVGLPF